MILRKFSLLNFKNILQAEIVFSPKLNCFFGNNGMGKTNLLDAIYYLSFCKSHLNTNDSLIIHNGEDLCVVQGSYEYDEHVDDIFCAIRRNQRKQFKRNKKEYERLSQHIGLIPLVMVSPADASLIQGGSDERRHFMDQILSQKDKIYLNALIQYNKALLQRNSLLKDQRMEASLFDALELQLVRYAEVIFEKRVLLIKELLPFFNAYYQQICNSKEQVGLNYVSQLSDSDFEKELRLNRERDLIIGYTSVGIHKDELDMKLGDYLIRRIGSQGQNKTYLIALKLAQFAYLKSQGMTTPLLLLDDIFDKLDADRVASIIRLVSGNEFGQIFVTDTNRKYLDTILESMQNDFALFKVDNGNVEPLKESEDAKDE